MVHGHLPLVLAPSCIVTFIMAQGEEMEVDSKPAEVNGVSDAKDGELQLLFSL